MNFSIITSKKDTAGMNIARELKKLGVKVNLFEEDSIYLENIDKKSEFKDADFIIFTTKHQSEQKIKTLTVHAPGNWKSADYGGKIGKICPTNSLFLKHIFQILNKNFQQNPISEFKISMEVTHHGPYLEKPCCFIEIGSSENEWKIQKAGKIIAKTVKQAIETFNLNNKQNYISAICIGGPHYCANFNKIQLNSRYAIGHIIPEYALPLTEQELREAINKTIPKPELAILDWKGCGKSESRKEIINLLNSFNLKFERTGNIEK